ncbi:MAG: hypothetical protein AAB546_02770 [Patescibacteria group bacterium]
MIILLVVLVTIPTFYRMLRVGIYSMQDFHFFRLFEFDKCIKDLQIPCRWSPDVGLSFGEPLFNFYGQLSYAFGEIFALFGFSLIASLKLVFIASLVLSAISMFYLAKHLWKSNFAGFLSAIIYLYAPYRAVDVWVRGALPESVSFVFYPLIILFFEKYLAKQKKTDLLLFGLSVSALVVNHNLSFVLFLPFLVIWLIFRLIAKKAWKLIPGLLLTAVLSAGLIAFYVLPVVAESKYITLESTIVGYFDFKGHFVGIRQLFLSNNWGYGGSVFGPADGLNLSIGFVQWAIVLLTTIILVIKKQLHKNKSFLILLLIFLVLVGLIHGKSVVFWQLIPQMAYIQFPWRFLGIIVFTLALASGAIMQTLGKKYRYFVLVLTLIVSLFVNQKYFQEDIWYTYTDADLTTGEALTMQTRASIGDYWPNFSGISVDPAPADTIFAKLISKKSNEVIYEVATTDEQISFPINYFPGWTAYSQGKKIETRPDSEGKIRINAVNGQVVLKFTNTKVRTIGNIISLISLVGFVSLLIKSNLKKEK